MSIVYKPGSLKFLTVCLCNSPVQVLIYLVSVLVTTVSFWTYQNTNLVHNSFNIQQYICYITLLNMFRAARCSSSGGPIISPQPLVSSPSVSSRTVCGWRAVSLFYGSTCPVRHSVLVIVWLGDYLPAYWYNTRRFRYCRALWKIRCFRPHVRSTYLNVWRASNEYVSYHFYDVSKNKIHFIQEKATKTQRGSRGIALLFL